MKNRISIEIVNRPNSSEIALKFKEALKKRHLNEAVWLAMKEFPKIKLENLELRQKNLVLKQRIDYLESKLFK